MPEKPCVTGEAESSPPCADIPDATMGTFGSGSGLNEPRWLFFVRPVRITTWQGVDWAKRYKHYQWGA